MALENKESPHIVFLPREDITNSQLIEDFKILGFEVQEQPPHPLVQAILRVLPFRR